MSQPREENAQDDSLLEPLKDLDSLLSIFHNFEKPRSNFRVGVEHERFIVTKKTLMPAPWSTAVGIRALLTELLPQFQKDDPTCTPALDHDQIIAIMRKNSSITLEPGGQLELSGAPIASIFDIDEEIKRYDAILEATLKKMNLGYFLMGFHPVARQSDFEWVPKQRYEIMRKHMLRTGHRGHDMMLRTCTVQANFDYESESDMIDSFRTVLLISPVITAMFASSPFKDGRPSGYLSERSMVWKDTDAVRSGFPIEVFESNFGYRRWIERALQTPMYFVRRNGTYHDATSISFAEFVKNGFQGFKATKRDFEDHLTTIFTDTRIKPQLEVRPADCGPKPFLRALPAFLKGLIYDVTARSKVLSLLSNLDPKKLDSLQIEAAREGLGAHFESGSLAKMAEELLAISKAGLERLNLRPDQPSEAVFLRPLEKVVESGKNTAQQFLESYNKNQSFDWLLDAF